MAEGVASLADEIDFVFSGESEIAWPAFLTRHRDGEVPTERIIRGPPTTELDAMPTPDYGEFYAQRTSFLPDAKPEDTWLPYDASRGCWHGQRHQCTFCGINLLGIGYRQRSAGRVLSDLTTLLGRHPSRKVLMADNIMPRSFFRTLIPRLETELPGLTMYYLQRPGLTLEEVVALVRAGVAFIQPGIEALSSSLLARMNKDVSASHNIELLRWARSVGLPDLPWYLLYDLPDDRIVDWQETLALIPLLHHLHPPLQLRPITIARFSPYFDSAANFGMKNLRPFSVHDDVFPEDVDTSRLAFDFEADYDNGSRGRPDLIDAIRSEVDSWRRAWNERPRSAPALSVQRLGGGTFLLRDTRGLPATRELQVVSREQASTALVSRPVGESPEQAWALDNRIAVILDGQLAPLATAEPTLLQELTAEG
jgi:ribosomal peptide maturation radical SAM protein 1